MSATKRPRTVLDTGAMSTRQLLRELEKVQAEILERLSNCEDVGTGDYGASEPSPEAIDEGILFAARVDVLSTNFMYGGHTTADRDSTWSLGVEQFKERLAGKAVELAGVGAAS